jgi:hypothetical protein
VRGLKTRHARQAALLQKDHMRENVMDPKQMLRQMVAFNKAAFENSFNSMALLQEQAERTAKTILEQAAWLPDEGRKAINDWVDAYKKGRTEYKKVVDDGFRKVEEYLMGD